MTPRLVGLASVAVCVTAVTTTAASEQTGLVWGITTGEVLLPAEIALIVHEPGTQANATFGQKAIYFGTVLASAAIPTTVGVLAQAHQWDTTVPRAVNLGLFTGVTFLAIGAALTASDDDDRLIPKSPIPWALGAAGAFAGGFFAVTQVNAGSQREAGLVATGAMTFVGAALPSLVVLVAEGAFVNETTMVRHARRTLAIGGTVGLAAGYATMALLPNAAPNVAVTPTAGGALVKWSGAF